MHSFTLDAESLDVLCRHGLSVSLVRCETSETRRMRSIGLLLVHVPQAQRQTCLALRTLHPTNPMEFVFLRIGKGCSNLVDLESRILSILTSCSLVSLLSILFSLALLPLSSWEPFERVVLHNRSTAGFRRKHDPAQRVSEGVKQSFRVSEGVIWVCLKIAYP